MSSVPVLIYHHVAPDREITPAGFERQLSWLAGNGYASLSGDELYAHLSGARPAPERSVALTFDDGYADNWVYAFPALEKYGMKAAVFVVTSKLSESGAPRPTSEAAGALPDTITGERAPEGFLSWAEAKAMSDSGLVEIGSHTHTHKGFDRGAAYADLAGELARSRREISTRLGRWSGLLAWPWGDFDEGWLALLGPAGYRLAFTARPGANEPGGDPFRICRFKVQNEDLGWLKSRLGLYRRPWLARLYGRLYGFDRVVKSAFGGGGRG